MKASERLPWPDKYRPGNMFEVVGQAQVKTRLTEIVRSGKARHIILHGPSGSGKTTLARIYAQALVCRAPVEGAPCRTCEPCREFPHPTYGVRLINGAEVSKQDVVSYLGEFRRPSIYAKHNVFLFDEAHRLSRPASEALLTALEDPKLNVTLVFALIDPGSLPSALRGRCRILPVSAATEADALEFATRIAANESVAFEPAALKLLWANSRNLRAVARDLEEIAAEGDEITVDSVRRWSKNDPADLGFELLNRLARNDLNGQLKIVEQAATSAGKLASATLAAVNHIFAAYVLAANLGALSEIDDRRYDPATCAEIHRLLAGRADVLGLHPDQLIDGLVEFWAALPKGPSAEVVKAHVLRAHRRVWGSWLSADVPPIVASLPPSDGLRRYRRRARRITPVSSEAYMSRRQALRVFDASSFVMQGYGQCFNAGISLGSSSPRSEAATAHAVHILLKDMRERVQAGCAALGLPRQFHRVLVFERTEGELKGTLVFHLPPALEPKLKLWLAKRLEQLGLRADPADNPVDFVHYPHRDDRVSRHWHLTRRLLAGTSPGAEYGGQTLLDIFGIRQGMRHRPNRLVVDRYSISESIGRAGCQQVITREGPLLSALEDGAFDRLFTGWELDEYEARTSHFKSVEKNRLEIAQELEDATDTLGQLRLKTVYNQIDSATSLDAKLRQRSWKAWW